MAMGAPPDFPELESLRSQQSIQDPPGDDGSPTYILCGDFTMDELEKLLRSLPPLSSPGVGHITYAMLRESLMLARRVLLAGKIPYSHRKGVKK